MQKPSAKTTTALATLAALLRCPNCGAPLGHTEHVLRCSGGHSFDIARQGYVALQAAHGKIAAGDSPAMVQARETFLAGGHYTPIADAIVDEARVAHRHSARPPVTADLGAGTGYYLAALLERGPGGLGIALDASRPALRRAVRAHPQIAAIACDVWRDLPLQNASVDLLINVFAPRNAREIPRVLAADGTLLVVTPTSRHLRQLAGLGMLGIQTDKQARLRARLSPDLSLLRQRELEFEMTLSREDVHRLLGMGPSSHHLDADDLRDRLERRGAGEFSVGASVMIETFRRTAPPARSLPCPRATGSAAAQ